MVGSMRVSYHNLVVPWLDGVMVPFRSRVFIVATTPETWGGGFRPDFLEALVKMSGSSLRRVVANQ